MSSVIEILSKLKQEITDVLKKAYANNGITCKVNNEIVKILMNSGLEKAAKNMSDSELEQVAVILSKNAENISSAANSLTCSLKGGRRKWGGSKQFEDFLFIDGKQKGGTRSRAAQEEGDYSRSHQDEYDGSFDFYQRSPSPPPARAADSAPAASIDLGPMPTSANQAQDIVANMDSYEILAALYILLINGGLLATGVYASAIDSVAGAAGEAIGLPDIKDVCGIGRKQTRDRITSYMSMSSGQGSYMTCADAQQKWETLLISLGVSVFVFVAILSSLGSRRMDSSAYSRGALAMTYEVSMSGVTTLGNVLRGVPKEQESPIFESRSVVIQAMTNPIRALANAARKMVESASNLWPSRSVAQPQPTLAAQSLSKTKLDEKDTAGGRKKLKTHRLKAQKSKKARRTRKKVQKKTRKAKKAKKAKKARKSKRR